MKEEKKAPTAPDAQTKPKPRRKRKAVSGASAARAKKAASAEASPTSEGTAAAPAEETGKTVEGVSDPPGADMPCVPLEDAPPAGADEKVSGEIGAGAEASPTEAPRDADPEMPAESAPEAEAPAAVEDAEASERSAEGEISSEVSEAAAPDSPEAPEEGAAGEESPAKASERGAEGENSSEAPEEAAPDEDVRELLPARDAQRISDMSRTVQISVEKILAEAEADSAVPDEAPDRAEEISEEGFDAEAPAEGILSGVAKWFLLVLFFVLVIACAGVAWLYRSATPDMLPQLTVSFGGQEVAPTAYKWKVPVVGSIFKRTYAETLSVTTTALTDAIEEASPDLTVSDSEYETCFTVTDTEQEVVFEGTANEFSSYRFTENGVYTGKLVVSDASDSDSAEVTGSETWMFTFTVALRPSVTLATRSVTAGSVAAVRVGTTLSEEAPTLEGELEAVGFVKASSGWICYVPIPWDQAAGTVTLAVSADGYTEELTLTIASSSRDYKDYSSSSQLVSPYIGADDAPAEVKRLLTEYEEEIAWAGTGFIQPFLSKITTTLTFGMSEYVGRSYSERTTNTGAGGRTSTSTVVKASSGESFVSPSNGTVLLAEDLGGEYGLTLVIDHGAGLKSIFYGLQSLDVKKGEQVKQGQVIAVCNRYTVCETRIGAVPVDSVKVWNNQCDGLKCY